MTRMKQILSLLLVCCLAVSLLPATALAEEIRLEDSGTPSAIATEEETSAVYEEVEEEADSTVESGEGVSETDQPNETASDEQAAPDLQEDPDVQKELDGEEAETPAQEEMEEDVSTQEETVSQALAAAQDETTIVDSGTCGAQGGNLTWILDSEGTLTISGTGAMMDYEWPGEDGIHAPWNLDADRIQTIEFGAGITTIGNFAFWYCRNLISTKIPYGVTSIGKNAFEGCSSLTDILIPEGVISIGDWAFDSCSGLTNIKVPKSVASIGDYAFSGCTGLIDIVLPESLTSIGTGTFQHCGSLTSIVIPDGVTSLGESAFYLCNSLTSVTLPESVTSIGSFAFYKCSRLINIVLPKNVTSIDIYAFYWCSSLTSIVIPDGVTSIGDYTFYNCSSLTSVTLPESATSIGAKAFYFCSSLTNMAIPDGVTSIGGYAFYDCSSLTSVTLPESVTSIGAYAFYRCSSLTSLEIPYGVTSINNSTFKYCGLTSISIPDSVESIGECAFDSCSNLTSIVLPESVTSIGRYAFYYCRKLTSITIPGSVNFFGEYAFRACDGVTSIRILDGLTSIGYGIFCDCSSLTNITIPGSVTSIDETAFVNCMNLTDVYYSDSEEMWGKIQIDSGNEYLTDAIIHYNSTGSGEDGSTNIPSGDVRFFSAWDEAAGTVCFDNDMLLPSKLADTVDTSGLSDLVGRYVLVTEDIDDSFSVTGIRPVESHFGTVTENSDQSMTIDGTTYPVSHVILEGAYVGDKVLVHTYDGVIVEIQQVQEQRGVLDAWDSDTGEATIDGTVYQTNYMSHISNYVDELVGKTVSFSAASTTMYYTPVLELSFPTGFYFSTNAVTSSIERGTTVELYVGYYGENGALDPNTKEYISTVSNSDVIEATPDGWNEQYGQHYTITGKGAGTAVLTVTNPANGDSESMNVSVIEKQSGYQFDNLPEKVYEEGKITHFYNYYGMVVNDFAYTPHRDENGAIDYYVVTMTVYNSLNLYGAVTSYDQSGKPYGFYLIDKITSMPTGFVDTVQDIVTQVGDLFYLIDNNYFYSGESVSQKTNVEIKVPVGGYLEISNSASSDTVFLANMLSLLVEGAGTIVDLGTSADKLLNAETPVIVDIIQEDYIEGKLKDVMKETVIEEFKHANWNYDNYGACLQAFLNRLSEFGINLTSAVSEKIISVTGIASITETVIMKVIPTGNLINFLYDVLGASDQVSAWIIFQKSMKFSEGIYIYAPTKSNAYISNGVSVEVGPETTSTSLVVHAYVVMDEDEIHVTEDTFPDDEIYRNHNYKLYNITMYQNGQETQPNGPVTVRIPLTEAMSGVEQSKLAVYRINEDGTATNMAASIIDGYAVFTTEHFSYYAVTYPGETTGETNTEVSGTLTSWEADTEATYYLYDDSLTDEEIRADFAQSDHEFALFTGTGSEPSIGADGRYEQQFSFCDILPGTYKLAIYKTDKYVPQVLTVTVEQTSQDLGSFCLQMLGDVNGDGKVTTIDAALANSCARGASDLEAYALACADVSGNDGKVTVIDAALINAHARGVSALWE